MKSCDRKLIVFFSAAFGLPVVLGIFMGAAFYGGKDVGAFPLTWMFLPASGVMLGRRRRKSLCRKRFMLLFL